MKSEVITVLGQAIGLIALALLMVAMMIGTFWIGCRTAEAIVSIHSISTREAPGFTEEKFGTVNVEMAVEQVRRILGTPLRTLGRHGVAQEWWYTESKEPIEDWGTWDARIVTVSNNVVTEIYSSKCFNQ